MYKKTDKSYAFVFQGLGIEFRKYLNLLDAESNNTVKKYCRSIKSELGLDLRKYIDTGDCKISDPCLLEQLCIFMLNCVVYEVYINHGIMPSMLYGYSLGLISALVCSKAVTFEQGIHLVVKGYELPKKALDKLECSMGVIVGLTMENVSDIIIDTGNSDFVEIAIENNQYCLVISGIKKNVKAVMHRALADGALKVIEVNAPVPYHSKFIKKGAKDFYNFTKDMYINNSAIPIVSGVDQRIFTEPIDIKNEIYKNVLMCISLKKAIEKLCKEGISTIIEVGLGESITKLLKYMDYDLEFNSFSNLAGGLKHEKVGSL